MAAITAAIGLANPQIGQADGAVVDNAGGASNVVPGMASLQGSLTEGPADVNICWGTTDGGTNGPWENTNALPNVSDGPFSGNVSNLLYGLTYYYRCFASNASGTAWAPDTASFTTLKPWAAAAASLRHRWSFNDGTMNDSMGAAHGAAENGNVTVVNRRLFVSAAGRMLTSAIGNPISNKTLVVWTSLLDPGDSTGGAALTLEDSAAGGIFDGIVYGQFLSSKWAAGSASNATAYPRSQRPQQFGTVEFVGEPGEVMIAIAYAPDNSLAIYRNGILYGKYTKGTLATYPDTSVVQIGRRNGENNATYLGYVNEARIYSDALSSNQVLQLLADGPDSMGSGIRLTSSPATGITSTSAVLNATLACPGAAYDVYAYWNTTSGGSNTSQWTNEQYVGTWTNADSTNIRCTVTGLTPDTTYFFTFRATNVVDDLWATNVLRFGPLAVDNDSGATDLAPGQARLRGTLHGADSADVTVFWGLTDEGTNGPWMNANGLPGISSGPFSTTASNLLYNVQYFYRCYASNGTGTAWAPATTNFTLPPPPPTLTVFLDEKTSGNQLAYANKVSSTDLINAINTAQPTLSRISVYGYTPYPFGPASTVGAPDYILNNGAHGGSTIVESDYTGNAAFDGSWGEFGQFIVTYYLNMEGQAAAGYNLKTIDIFTAHHDGRAGQQFEVFVDYVSPGENWVSLGKFASATPGGSEQAHHMQLANGIDPGVAPFATRVAAIRFALTGTFDYGEVWREIDVQGKVTPSIPAGGTLFVR